MSKWIASWTLFRLYFPSNILVLSLKVIWFVVLSASWMLLRLVDRLDFFWLEVRFFFSYKTVYEAVEQKAIVSLLADRTTDLVNFIVKAD